MAVLIRGTTASPWVSEQVLNMNAVNPYRASSLRFEQRFHAGEGGITAIDCLAGGCSLSRAQLKNAMAKGAVWLGRGAGAARRLRRAKTRLNAGAVMDLYYDQRVLDASALPPSLVADEREYSVWYKPFGMLSQGSKWGDHCSIARCAEKALSPERPALVVHRLDRSATGLILIAHHKLAAAGLSGLFSARQIDKGYRVVVHGVVALDHGVEQRIETPIDGRPATTRIRVLEADAVRQRTLLDVALDTGRKHQIRVHLSGLDHPVVGDRLYGTGEDVEDLQLTACRLAFRCPLTGEDRQYRLSDELLPKLQ